jgi:hypothetical protein
LVTLTLQLNEIFPSRGTSVRDVTTEQSSGVTNKGCCNTKLLRSDDCCPVRILIHKGKCHSAFSRHLQYIVLLFMQLMVQAPRDSNATAMRLTDKNVLALVFGNTSTQPRKEIELTEACLYRKVTLAPSIVIGN